MPDLKTFLVSGICLLYVALDFCFCVFLPVVLMFAIVVFVLYYEKKRFYSCFFCSIFVCSICTFVCDLF